MNLSLLNNKAWASIYYVSNTPSFFFNRMRENSLVHEISDLPSKQLIDFFWSMAAKPISKENELISIYGVCIALTFKTGNEVVTFFKNVSEKIKFEWFPDICRFYFELDQIQTTTQEVKGYSVENIQSLQISEPEIDYGVRGENAENEVTFN